jgi:hypothetical protein
VLWRFIVNWRWEYDCPLNPKVFSSKVTAMRAILATCIFLTFAAPDLGFAEAPQPKYTTVVIEYTGERITAVLPIVITTSQEEGEWYRQHFEYGQHFGPDVAFELPYIQVVPQSVLDEITGLPLLQPALKRARMIKEHLPGKPETDQNVTFSAGVRHDYASIIVDKQPSAKILKGIERIAAKYPSLEAGLHQVESFLK